MILTPINPLPLKTLTVYSLLLPLPLKSPSCDWRCRRRKNHLCAYFLSPSLHPLGNLSFDCKERDLYQYFSKYGKIIYVKIVRDK